MNRSRTIRTAIVGGAVVAAAGALTASLLVGDKRMFVPDLSTAGHHQIEQRCDLCHTPFRGVSNTGCLQCHEKELKLANDSHAPSKFADPRAAHWLTVLNARECRTCHHEHRPRATLAGGVTQPADHCYACHADVAAERPSHAAFNRHGCATTGCHKYHDNTALYEEFIARRLRDTATLPDARVPKRNAAAPLPLTGSDAAGQIRVTADILHAWQSTAHARSGVNCSGCHATTNTPAMTRSWIEKPGPELCVSCHQPEVDGFMESRHGMRIAQRLSPMSIRDARQPMKAEAGHKTVGCNSCHSDHAFDTRQAAVEACLSCHNDAHSLAYKASPHFRLWQAELSGAGGAGTGVSCATCHLPREQISRDGQRRVVVQHNQNANLRPNEKMIRSVCLHCHGFAFSAAALADSRLLQNNFTGRPSRPHESVAMVERRLVEAEKNNQSAIKNP